MNKENKHANRDRRARLQAIQAQQKTAERRKNITVYGTVLLLAAAIAAAVAFVIVDEIRQDAALTAAAEAPIEGVQTFEDLSRNHTETPVDYPQSPGAGGDHAPVWTNCGVYTEPVGEARAVHTLEHGAVWVSYRADLDPAGVEALTELVGERSYVLLSPVEGQDAAVTATAWGTQLALDDAQDPRLETFLTKYVQGPQTPEAGAPCTGGVDA